jgi:hypothetical protein
VLERARMGEGGDGTCCAEYAATGDGSMGGEKRVAGAETSLLIDSSILEDSKCGEYRGGGAASACFGNSAV